MGRGRCKGTNREGQFLGVQYPTHSNLFFRVFEDGVSPSQPEAKCDWARGGCAGAKSHPEFLIGFRVFEDGVNPI